MKSLLPLLFRWDCLWMDTYESPICYLAICRAVKKIKKQFGIGRMLVVPDKVVVIIWLTHIAEPIENITYVSNPL